MDSDCCRFYKSIMPCWSSLVRTPPSQGGDHRFKSGTGYETQMRTPSTVLN